MCIPIRNLIGLGRFTATSQLSPMVLSALDSQSGDSPDLSDFTVFGFVVDGGPA